MKKIFLSVLAVAALASCTKMDTAYEAPQEIGFVAVGSNITKAPVDGDVYPTSLNMYVNAYVHSTSVPETPDYISNGEFKYKNVVSETTGEGVDAVTTNTNVWGGVTPYYWPNEKTLHFSGFSKSGSFTSASYDPSEDKLIVNGYNPGTSSALGANDLMWFPSTKYVEENGYGKSTKYVPVNMYHTCSWITFMVQGDITTGATNSSYKITSLTMNGVDMTATVTCTGNASLAQATIPTYVVWSSNTDQTDASPYNVTVYEGGVALEGTYTNESTYNPKNIETNANTTTGGNIVVIPQMPGTIDLAWTYTSTTNSTISDSATGLSLSLGDDSPWLPGKHYVYTITIKANEILIAPTPVEWTDGANSNVTVE